MTRASAATFAVALLVAGGAQAAPDDLGAALAQLSQGRVVARSLSLADVGVREPLVLQAPDAIRELYLPVPANLPISDATLQLDGGYMRADGGRTTMLVSLDGAPVLARGFTQFQGDAAASLGVDGGPRPTGFVRLGLQWSSIINDTICTDQTAIGNVLRIAPTSRLTYRFDPASVKDLRTAWSALPTAPTVALSANKVGAPAYDVSWRTIALLQAENKRPAVRAWPVAGDTVDLTGVSVPKALQAVPAFAALAAGGQRKLASPAEAGAFALLASRSAFAPDIVVADNALREGLKTSLDALRAQVAAVSAPAAAAFDQWRVQTWAPITEPLTAGEVRLAHLPGQVVIVTGDVGGVAALAAAWRPIDTSNRVVVHQLEGAPHAYGDKVALSLLGGEPRTMEVLGRATWDANFDLSTVSGQGKLPGEVVLDIAAAPSASVGGQVASIYFNGMLIGSELLKQDGRVQRITARIPRYALGASNLLRVLFQRPPEDGCRARLQGYPVAVLPSSHVTLETASLDPDFTGMVARFASQANVMVPTAYLGDAAATLPRVARLANAAGIAPTRSQFIAVADNEAAAPKDTFLAIDVPLRDETGRAVLSKDRLTLTTTSDKLLADVSGLTNLGIVQVAKAGSASGVVYRTVGPVAPVLPATLRLSRGDVAVVASDGIARVFDTLHPGEVLPSDGDRPRLTKSFWSWAGPGIVVVVFLILLAVAGFARRRRQSKS